MKVIATTINNFPGFSYIQVKAPENAQKQPVHLCVILDTSASMDSENKLNNVKQSMKFLLDFLGPEDKLSVVTFSQVGKIVINGVQVSPKEKENIRTRISLIMPESNTNLSGGIIAAQDCLFNDTKYKQGILLLTDGYANIGITMPNDITKLSTNLCKLYPGTSISTIGYGTTHNVELLQNISSEGGGSYYVVNDMEDVAQVFGDILGGLLSCVAQQVTVQLPSQIKVKTRYAVHYIDSTTNTSTENKTSIIIGDMPSGMNASFIAEIGINTPVIVKGYSLETNENFAILSEVLKNNDQAIQLECEAHYLRFVVLELIEKSRSALLKGSDITELLNDIQKYSLLITNYKEHDSNNNLWDILLEELKECNQSLENYKKLGHNYDSQTSAQVMGQRTTFLGRMKGIAAKGVTPRYINENTSPLPRGFSNIAQRQISTQLQSQMSPQSLSIPLPDVELERQLTRCISDDNDNNIIRSSLQRIISN
jgi:hypothetical protein